MVWDFRLLYPLTDGSGEKRASPRWWASLLTGTIFLRQCLIQMLLMVDRSVLFKNPAESNTLCSILHSSVLNLLYTIYQNVYILQCRSVDVCQCMWSHSHTCHLSSRQSRPFSIWVQEKQIFVGYHLACKWITLTICQDAIQ